MNQKGSELSSQSENVLIVFAILWGIATLFHQAKAMTWSLNQAEFLLSFVAIFSILNPISLPVTLIFLCVQAGVIIYELPLIVTNHWLFTFFIDLIILGTVFQLLCTKRRFLKADEIYQNLLIPIRLAVIILYLFTVLHKLNTGFLNLQTSCAVEHYLYLKDKFPFLPTHQAVKGVIIAITLFLESTIPLLLVGNSTRLLGVIVGIGFHIILGINNFFDFSTMLLAVYIFFIPAQFSTSFLSRFSKLILYLKENNKPYILLSLFISILFVFLCSHFIFKVQRIFIFLGVIYGLVYLVFLIILIRENQQEYKLDKSCFIPRFIIHYEILFLLFLNGFSPYLGLKTQSVFSMFSNIRTEGGESNHLFIPLSIQIFDYQKYLIEILDDPNNIFKVEQKNAVAFTYLDFARLIKLFVSKAPQKLSVTYVYQGEIHKINDLKDLDVIIEQFSYFSRKFFQFRPVQKDSWAKCVH